VLSAAERQSLTVADCQCRVNWYIVGILCGIRVSRKIEKNRIISVFIIMLRAVLSPYRRFVLQTGNSIYR
jgi:hypothetical protein